MRVAVVDRYVSELWYSNMLTRAISKYCIAYYYHDLNVWNSSFFLLQILRRAIRDHVDVVHVQYEPNAFGGIHTNPTIILMLLLLRLVQKKVVVTLHAVIPKQFLHSHNPHVIPSNVPNNKLLLSIILTILYAGIGMFSNKLVLHAKVFKNWMRQYPVDPEKMFVVPHGNGSPTKYVGSNPTENMILCFGVLTPRKGLETLISAYYLLDATNAKLVIAGKPMSYYPDYMDELKQLVYLYDLEEKVTFTGYVPDQHIPKLFSEATIVVFPYQVCVSASGALAFAMQYAKPLIVSDTLFFHEILSDDEAIFVNKNDPASLAQAITLLLANSELQNNLRRNIKRKAETNCWANIAEQMMRVYS